MSVTTDIRWVLDMAASPDPLCEDEAHDHLLDSGFLCNSVPACTASAPHETCKARAVRILGIVQYADVDKAVAERDAWRDWYRREGWAE